MFYLISKTIPESYDPFLYGWTADKDLAERFKESRNMDRFRLVKKKMDDEESDITVVLSSGEQITITPDKIGEAKLISFGGEEKYDLNQTLFSILIGSEDKDAIVTQLPNGDMDNCNILYKVSETAGQPTLFSNDWRNVTIATLITSLIDSKISDRTIDIYFNFS